MLLDRRVFLAGAAALLPAVGRAAPGADARPGPRVAALNWGAALALASLGLPPVCTTELKLYAQFVVEPALPPETLETGLRPEPNFERLLAIRPDLILIDGELENIRPRLERIARTLAYDAFTPNVPDHWTNGAEAMRKLAAEVGRQSDCEAYLAQAERTLERSRAALARYDGRPLLLVSIVDARRALVFGKNSLFQPVLDRLGLKNAWDQPTSPYGHSVVTIDRLGVAPEARFVSVGNERIASEAMLRAHPVAGSIPSIRAGRITTLPALLFYGGLPAAVRFARLVGERLPAGGQG